MINDKIFSYLEKQGFYVNRKPYEIMDDCDSWYSNRAIDGFHNRYTVQGNKYTLDRTNMAKRCCSDDADLLEVVSVTIESQAENDIVNSVLENNNFPVMIREQLETMSSMGTVGAYLRIVNAEELDNGDVRGGEIQINYAKGTNIIPLKVINGDVKECAFTGVDTINGKLRYSLVIFTENNDVYSAKTVYFDKYVKELNSFDIVYPIGMTPFAIMKVAGANNLDDMDGFGTPKIWNAISYLKGVDLAWNTFIRDLAKSDKLVFINERLLEFDDDGEARGPNETAKQLFYFLGEKLPAENNLIYEYNPTVRVDDITKAMELNLSMLSTMFGYGTRKYSFDNGQIQTATEYIGERQDMMLELNKQRNNIRSYICDLCKGIIYLTNAMNGHGLNPDSAISVDFDDSYIIDRESMLKDMREDIGILGLPAITERYLVEKYKISDEEARAWIENKEYEDDDVETLGDDIS